MKVFSFRFLQRVPSNIRADLGAGQENGTSLAHDLQLKKQPGDPA
jgi:hypothetical protein